LHQLKLQSLLSRNCQAAANQLFEKIKQRTTATPSRERLLFVGFFDLRNNLFTAVKTVRRHSVSQMSFSGCRIDRKRRTLQLVM
jgi:hypothetical protein